LQSLATHFNPRDAGYFLAMLVPVILGLDNQSAIAHDCSLLTGAPMKSSIVGLVLGLVVLVFGFVVIASPYLAWRSESVKDFFYNALDAAIGFAVLMVIAAAIHVIFSFALAAVVFMAEVVL
jgi:hypothetical protein